MTAEPDPEDDSFCYDELYRSRTLKVVREIPFIGLFRDLKVHRPPTAPSEHPVVLFLIPPNTALRPLNQTLSLSVSALLALHNPLAFFPVHDQNNTKFEASGTVIAKDAAWVVFDNLRNIGRVSLDFKFMGPENILVPEKGEAEEASQFEGLAYSASTDSFIVVRETFEQHGLLLSRTEVRPWFPEYLHTSIPAAPGDC